MDNHEVIAKGGGSPQARWADECNPKGDCPYCNGKGWYWVPNGPDDSDKEPCECQEG